MLNAEAPKEMSMAFDVAEKKDKPVVAPDQGNESQEHLSRATWDSAKPLASGKRTQDDATTDKPGYLEIPVDSLYHGVHAKADGGSETKRQPEAASAGAAELPLLAGHRQESAKDIVIRQDVSPAKHEVKNGETLTKIAKEHLGADATPQEIHQHIKEIAELNGIKDANVLHDNQVLKLPGHTKDGGYVIQDRAMTKTTVWEDGTQKVEYIDGRGYTRRPETDGGISEHHWGPRPGDNFESKTSPDGSHIEIREKVGDKPYEPLDGSEVKTRREKLDAQAEKKIRNPEELAKFRADMARFEDRSRQMEDSYKKEGLSSEAAHEKAQQEVAKTYGQVDRILGAKDNPDVPIPESRRIEIAEQVMSQAAAPTSIDQGIHQTCSTATIESRVYTRNPSEAAKLVADMSTTGRYTTADGTAVELDKESLKPHNDAKHNPPLDGERSYASQLFQVTAVNVAYRKQGSDIHYEQHDADPTDPRNDGGCRYDYSTTPHQPVGLTDADRKMGKTEDNSRLPGLSDDEVATTGNSITGEKDKTWYVGHKESIYGSSEVNAVENEKQLQDQLRDAKEHGKLPLVIKVHTGNEPFHTDSGDAFAGESGGWHFVTVTDYHEGPPAKVAIDNQSGSDKDHTNSKSEVSVHDIYHSMRSPQDPALIADRQKDVDFDKAQGHPDYSKEEDLLRLKRAAGLGDAEYQKQLTQLVKESNADLNKRINSGDQDEHQRAFENRRRIQEQVKHLPPDQEREIVRQNPSFFPTADSAPVKERIGTTTIINQ